MRLPCVPGTVTSQPAAQTDLQQRLRRIRQDAEAVRSAPAWGTREAELAALVLDLARIIETHLRTGEV